MKKAIFIQKVENYPLQDKKICFIWQKNFRLLHMFPALKNYIYGLS